MKQNYMRKLLLLSAFTFIVATNNYAQNTVGIGTITPDTNAVLDLQSPGNNQGILVPRLTTAQRTAMSLTAAQNGLLVYDIGLSKFMFWDGSTLAWQGVGGGGGSNWTVSGSNIYNSNSGNVGIGLTNPLYKLDVHPSSTYSNVLLNIQNDNNTNGNSVMQILTNGTGNAINVNQSGFGVGLNVTSGSSSSNSHTVNFTSSGNGSRVLNVTHNGSQANSKDFGVYSEVIGGGLENIAGYFNAKDATNNYAAIFDNGNVGVGIANPSAKLHVAGTFRLVDGTQATGRVLTSDASGNATWQNPSQDWSLNGNAGITTANYLGPQNDVPLTFKIFDLQAGRIESGTYLASTFLGYGAGHNNKGISNTAVGNMAMFNNNNGGKNAAFGRFALYSNLDAIYNTAIGESSMYANETGNENTALGWQSLGANISGSQNTAIGVNAGSLYTGGALNTFLGYGSEAKSDSLTNATAIGANAVVQDNNRIQLGKNASVEFDLSLMPGGNAGLDGQLLVSKGLGVAPVWSSPASEGLVTGSGVATRLAFWSATNSLSSNANLYWNNTSSRLGIGTAAPRADLDVRNSLIVNDALGTMGVQSNFAVRQTLNPMQGTDTIVLANLAADFRQNTAANNSASGIKFTVGNADTYTGTAAIVAERTGSWSQGKLHFAVNNAGVSGKTDIPIMMTLDGPGNAVGIGTTAPAAKFTVVTTQNDGVSSATNGILLQNNSNGSGPWAQAGIWSVGSAGFNGSLAFGTDGDNTNNNNVVERMRINNTGQVGIGTSTFVDATTDFQVGNGTTNSSMSLNSSTAGGAFGIAFHTAGTYRAGLGYSPVAGQDYVYIYEGGTTSLVSKNGNIGVRNTNPTQALQVGGNVMIPAANDYMYATAKTNYYSVPVAAVIRHNDNASYGIIRNFTSGAPNYFYFSGGTIGAAAHGTAPVNLPHGAVVTNVSVSAFNSTGTIRSVELYRVTVGSATSIATINIPSDGVLNTYTTTANSTIDNSQFSYALRYVGDQNTINMRFYQVIITYTVTKAD